MIETRRKGETFADLCDEREQRKDRKKWRFQGLAVDAL